MPETQPKTLPEVPDPPALSHAAALLGGVVVVIGLFAAALGAIDGRVSGGVVLTRPMAATLAVAVLCLVLFLGEAAMRLGYGGRSPAETSTDRTTAAGLPTQTAARFRGRGIRGLYIGRDGRVSSSKLQVLLWTLALLFMLVHLALQGRCVGVCGTGSGSRETFTTLADLRAAGDLRDLVLREEYWVLLGIPSAAAVFAKAHTVKSHVGDKAFINAQEQKGGPAQGLREAVEDDLGQADLGDFQYLLFNLVGLAVVLGTFLRTPAEGIPAVPGVLLGLLGVSAAAYGVKKSVSGSIAPNIRNVTNKRWRLATDRSLRIDGDGFLLPDAPQPADLNTVLVNGRDVIGAGLTAKVTWTASRVSVTWKADIPLADRLAALAVAELGTNDEKDVEVVVRDSRGVDSTPCSVTLLAT